MSIVFTKILYKAKKLCYTTSSFLFHNIKVIIKCKYNKKNMEYVFLIQNLLTPVNKRIIVFY